MQKTALYLYRNVAQLLFLEGKDAEALFIFQRLGLVWHFTSKEVRQELNEEGMPGLLVKDLVDTYQESAEKQVEEKDRPGALESIRYCAQLLDIVEKNTWMPETVLGKLRSRQAELRQSAGEIAEQSEAP